jgi:hypothetical protein
LTPSHSVRRKQQADKHPRSVMEPVMEGEAHAFSKRALGGSSLILVLGVVLGISMPASAADRDHGMGTPPRRAESAPLTGVLTPRASRSSATSTPSRHAGASCPLDVLHRGWNEPWASPGRRRRCSAPGLDQRLRRRLLPPGHRDLRLRQRLRGQRRRVQRRRDALHAAQPALRAALGRTLRRLEPRRER